MAADYKIATKPLYIGYALAHMPGDLVPSDNVARNGWEDGVAGAGTKAAKEAQGASEDIGAPLPPQPETSSK